MAENKQNEQQDIKQSVQHVLNIIAQHLGSFDLNQRTGELSFYIEFDKGEIKDGGFEQIVSEKVL